MQDTRITICACTFRSFIDKNKVATIAATLDNAGYKTHIIPDLCEKVMRKDDDLAEIGEGIILACYPRAVKNHFNWLGLKAGKVVDIRNGSLEKVVSEFNLPSNPSDFAQEIATIAEKIDTFLTEKDAEAWYPVIDKERCTGCGKCFDFCLFGVYTFENKQVGVVNPQNCKNNCPACARMCPGKAIIFPKYEKSPINGGTADEEVFTPEVVEKLYRDRLMYRLQQRRAGVSLFKNSK